MPRILRGLGDGIVYHIINRGNGRQRKTEGQVYTFDKMIALKRKSTSPAGTMGTLFLKVL
jgi:hypothetical protein